ncbi:hypothetical protein Ddye_005042 [Dipteronia dyeriana]|uniref:Uncharacterized protein n=1 Tax=Dipteronia dyeriana TaxID=168575 RepID=A0AAE0CPD7_9ROSI|nr:hypothetical protein Ddye_005042 [Dipteronia dyeriana]
MFIIKILKAKVLQRLDSCVCFNGCWFEIGCGLKSEDKKELLRSYSLNPYEFLSEPSSKIKRRKELQKKGRGEKFVTYEEPKEKESREIHRLLQGLGGKTKRKKLLCPKGMNVHPMMEVVKGAAFDILQVDGGCPTSLRPSHWLDLYSGIRSVGMEAISRRGFDIEKHSAYESSWTVNVRVWMMFLLGKRKDGPFDYIIVTPPYTQVDYGILMDQMSKSTLIRKNTFIVVEYPVKTDMMESCGCLVNVLSSVCNPSVTVYKGYGLLKET